MKNVFMSREIVCGIKRKGQPKLSKQQEQVNKDTLELMKCCMNELYFIIKAQPFPYSRSVTRFADFLMESDTKVMKMLENRSQITAKVFDNDQIIFEKMIGDWRREIAVQYRELNKFMLTVEETHAFEGFRAMFNLPEYTDNMTDEERHIANFVNRKFVWLNGAPEEVWLWTGLQYYNNARHVENSYKLRLMSRYGPE
ncbi:unnamed protein product [Caenorhabditis brenneri]